MATKRAAQPVAKAVKSSVAGGWRRFWGWIGKGLLIAIGLFLLLQCWYLMHVVVWIGFNPGTTRFMDIRLSELRRQNPNAKLTQQWVPYSKISSNLKRAVIASEDSNFLGHNGVEWVAIESALKRNMHRGKVVRGGSTISQQLAKNLFLTSERSYWRKGQELLITFMIEGLWSKKRILEVYLNVAEWGNGLYGAQAASRRYYGVDAANLSSAQAAKLASMLPAPRYFDSHFNSSRYLARKTGTVQARMYQVAIPK